MRHFASIEIRRQFNGTNPELPVSTSVSWDLLALEGSTYILAFTHVSDHLRTNAVFLFTTGDSYDTVLVSSLTSHKSTEENIILRVIPTIVA